MNDRLVLKMHADDNIAVALTDLGKGDTVSVEGAEFTLQENVSAKHKLALQELNSGDKIIMYGILVGTALKGIKTGELISTANITHASGEFVLEGKKSISWSTPEIADFSNLTFLGYQREDGKIGTANYWVVIPLVFCENRNLQYMKDAMLEELGYRKGNNYKEQVKALIRTTQNERKAVNEDVKPKTSGPFFENIDGIKFLSHTMGCGGTPADARSLCGLLAGYICHPNVAGATILSLGCQDAQVEILVEEIHRRDKSLKKPVLIFEQQKHGTEYDLLSNAIQQTFNELVKANECKRKPAPLSKLTIGVECGGSDGFSGISANPAIGHVADMLTALGGSVILSEFPELCGVEQELVDRCLDTAKAKKFVELQKAYAEKAEVNGAGFYLNPSPGNIKDGLITDAMKSAGAVKKGGTSPIVDVLDYPEMITNSGLNLLCTPGNDVESTTALAGAGANLILFSTGLGTPTGNPITPVIKVSSNTTVAEKMYDVIDVDSGKIISGEETIEEVGKRLLNYCIEVASGNLQAKASQNGQDDFIPWKRGVSL